MTSQSNLIIKNDLEQETKLWRYMSITKFIWMLQKEVLYLARLDCLGDEMEGLTIPHSPNNKPSNYPQNFNTEHHEEITLILASYANCWNHENHENDLLWHKYVDDKKTGVVIQTTREDLENSIHHIDELEDNNKRGPFKLFINGEIKIGNIEYLVNNKGTDPQTRVFQKRKPFSGEKESRLVAKLEIESATTNQAFSCSPDAYCETLNKSPNHLRLNVDLNKLIKEVRISPYAETGFLEIVENLMSTYGLEVQPKQSEIAVDTDQITA